MHRIKNEFIRGLAHVSAILGKVRFDVSDTWRKKRTDI